MKQRLEAIERKKAAKAAEIKATADLLRAKGPLTAAQIAEALGCSKPTAYQRLRALEAAGHKLYTHREPRQVRGPAPASYKLR